MVKPTNNSHCEAISIEAKTPTPAGIEAKTPTPAGEVCNLASLEGHKQLFNIIPYSAEKVKSLA